MKICKSHLFTYYYSASKQLDYVTGSKSYDFSYDDKGNVTDNGKRGFVYNTADQLVESDGYSYTYDGNNKRVKEVGSTGISYSFYASNGKLMYRQVNGEHVDYYYLGGKLIAEKKGATVMQGAKTLCPRIRVGTSVGKPKVKVNKDGQYIVD